MTREVMKAPEFRKTELPDAEAAKSTQRTQKNFH